MCSILVPMAAKKVLVVDDEKAFQFLISKALEKEGYKILLAGNGLEAVEVALSEHPDLILMDLFMPVKDGLSAIRDLREDAWGKTVKIVVLTNVDYPETVQESKGLNIQQYLVKSNQSLKDIAVLANSLTAD